MKFRKKPVVIEAVQWTGENHDEITEFIPAGRFGESGEIYIWTFGWEIRADKGDWIVKGVKGEFYPCKPDIFEQTHEKVDD